MGTTVTVIPNYSNTALAQPPTANSIADMIHKDGSYTYDNTTDSLEMLSDKVGAYTGDGGAAADDSVKAELDLIKAKTDTIASAAVSTASATTAGVIVQDSAAGTPGVVDVTIASLAADTLSAYVALDAAVSADSWMSHFAFAWKSTADQSGGVINFTAEIATGGAGAEAVKIRFSWPLITGNGANIYSKTDIFVLPIPIKVASGTRIAARWSSSINNVGNSCTLRVGLSMYQGLET